MQDNIEIRRVSAEDFSALRKIYERVRKESFFWMDSREIRPEDFDRDTEGEEIWAAWQGEEAAGFISLWVPERFIHHLFVSRTFQGQGIGTGLIRKAAEIYGLPLSLKCVCDNRRALDFYCSRGWRITERGKSGEETWYRLELEDRAGGQVLEQLLIFAFRHRIIEGRNCPAFSAGKERK